MKNEFSDVYDDKDFFSSSGDSEGLGHENEVGVAVNEHPQASAGPKDDPFASHDEEDYLFSKTDNEIEENEEGESEDNSNVAFAESSKERLVDKIKGNLIYIFIALILIVPGSFKLYSMLFGSGEVTPAQTSQNVAFTETGITEPAVPETPTEKTPSEVEIKSEENAVRSTLNKLNPFGGGSEEKSANMPVNEEKMNEGTKETPKQSGAVASILGGQKEGGSEQILDRYFAQESKVEQQLSELLGKMDDIEARLATIDDLDKRLTALENNKNVGTQNNDQLQQLVKRIGQLEQNMNQMRQQVRKPAPAAPAGTNNQPGASASANAAGISVEAVIPGRAWIRTQEGVLMVVEVGDEIPGVGKVTRIDAREGIVATTTQIFKQ
ncbi:MAG: hypothetical protein ACHP9Y_02755 [Gammaproteobacteria bacterium]